MFDISLLKNDSKEKLEIDMDINFTSEDLKDTPIKDVKDIKAKGTINRVSNDLYHLELNITGTLVLTCARSLENVLYPIDIFIDKNIEEEPKSDEKPLILQNSLDIFAIVWENIILEVPLRVVKEDANFISEGNGWSLVEENDKEETKEEENDKKEIKEENDKKEKKEENDKYCSIWWNYFILHSC